MSIKKSKKEKAERRKKKAPIEEVSTDTPSEADQVLSGHEELESPQQSEETESTTTTKEVPEAPVEQANSEVHAVAATPSADAPNTSSQPESPKPEPLPKTPRQIQIANGHRFRKLAGEPSREQHIAVFGKSDATSWQIKADLLGVTPESLCEKFRTDPDGVKKDWDAYLAAKTKKKPATPPTATATEMGPAPTEQK